jgi:ribonuclease J
MKIVIHRGLDQIGGCITEISTSTSRVFIDMGKNLPGNGEMMTPEQEKEMVEELFAQNKKEHEAVIYTHVHEDHVGMFGYVPDDVPQYIGEGGKAALFTKNEWIKKGLKLQLKSAQELGVADLSQCKEIVKKQEELLVRIQQFLTWERSKRPRTFSIGDIQITPFFNSHSAYDSYMLLIEVDEKRIWHMGDYRKHGYLGKRLLDVLRIYARNIDVLITEGTMLGRTDECIHERIVSKKMASVMEAFKYVFVLASSTDIERLASIKEASKKAGKSLYVCSGMMRDMMRLFTERESKISKGLFDFHPRFYNEGRSMDSLKKNGFVMVVGVGQKDRVYMMKSELPEEETLLIYSSWDGYYKDPEQVKVNPQYLMFRQEFHNVVDIHTSGHADRQAIKDVIETVNPKQAVICIHKDKDQTLDSLDLSEDLKKKIVNQTLLTL